MDQMWDEGYLVYVQGGLLHASNDLEAQGLALAYLDCDVSVHLAQLLRVEGDGELCGPLGWHTATGRVDLKSWVRGWIGNLHMNGK